MFKKYVGKEEDFQRAIKQYLETKKVLWFHPPNEIKANVAYLKKRSSLGVKSGIADVIILEPRGMYHGLFIELKVGYNKPSPSQNSFLEESLKRNYLAKWTNSLDEAIYIIDQYLDTIPQKDHTPYLN